MINDVVIAANKMQILSTIIEGELFAAIGNEKRVKSLAVLKVSHLMYIL